MTKDLKIIIFDKKKDNTFIGYDINMNDFYKLFVGLEGESKANIMIGTEYNLIIGKVIQNGDCVDLKQDFGNMEKIVLSNPEKKPINFIGIRYDKKTDTYAKLKEEYQKIIKQYQPNITNT
jgi:hypothetical protein